MFDDLFEDQYDELEIENEYLTLLEVQQLLYIGRNTVYKLVNSGELPAFRVGKLWRVSRQALLEYASGKNRSPSNEG